MKLKIHTNHHKCPVLEVEVPHLYTYMVESLLKQGFNKAAKLCSLTRSLRYNYAFSATTLKAMAKVIQSIQMLPIETVFWIEHTEEISEGITFLSVSEDFPWHDDEHGV